MRTFAALVRKDLKGYFDQPTGFILLVIFVSIASYMYFRTALITQEASMRPLFTLLPWVLAVFVPAATMRLVAEEQRDGTLEILLTQPLRTWTVLLAKFLAGLLFVGAGIAATISIPLSLQTAGDFRRWGGGGAVHRDGLSDGVLCVRRAVHVEPDTEPDRGVRAGAVDHRGADGRGDAHHHPGHTPGGGCSRPGPEPADPLRGDSAGESWISGTWSISPPSSRPSSAQPT